MLAALVAAAIGASNCGGTSLTSATSPSRCQVSLSGSPTSFPASGGSGTVSVSTDRDCTWSATAGAPWISLSGITQGQGDGSFQFSVAANSVVSARTGAIGVNGLDFTISEAPASCTFSVAPSTVSIDAAGGAASVGVQTQASCAWTADVSVPWLTIASGSSGSGSGSVSLSAAANNGAARSTTVSVAGQPVVVIQAAAPGPPPPPTRTCTYAISPSSQDFGASGGSGRVSVATSNGCAWSATSSASWVTVTGGLQGSGDGSVRFVVDANTGPARSTTLAIADQAFVITQAAGDPPTPPCEYVVSPTSVSVDAGGGDFLVGVSTTAGCSWTATSNVPWMTITQSAAGTGSATVGVSVAKNNNAARTGTLTVAGQAVTVTEAAGKNGGGDEVAMGPSWNHVEQV